MDNFFFGGGFSVLFVIVFLLILGMFIFVFVSNIARAARDRASPRLTVQARVVAKRAQVWNHYTYYYATFEVESGDRMELSLDGEDFGLLAEGDSGELTFHGGRFLSFERR
ncbi:MAG: DUF2500 domain-containing protein [Eubacteriales bacterium]|nr:DUF2500 domain-containing protein [Eubacteriales bacterium]